MPSGPPAFLTFVDLRSPCTRSNVITGKGIGHLRGEGGGGMPESSRVELEENRMPKRLAFSVRELATEPSDRIRGGKADLQKLSLIHISEPTRLLSISYAVFCLKK